MVVGCSSEHRESIETTAQAIVGGWDSAQNGVVALVGPTGVVCTGTVIAPHVVLTAAHCHDAGAIAVAFGIDPGAPSAVARISAFLTHPAFDAATLSNDVGAAILETVAPSAGSVRPLYRDPLPPGFAQAAVLVAGYGATGTTAPSRRREGWASVTSVASTTFTTKRGPSQPCRGDSGGPAFVDTNERPGGPFLVGVISSGDPSCSATTTYTRVDAVIASFVDPVVVAAAPGAQAVGRRCYHPASCAAPGSCRPVDGGYERAYCTRSCDAGHACPSAMECRDGTCAFAIAPGTNGAACLDDSDCDSRLCARSRGAASCAQPCIPNVLDCAVGEECRADEALPSRRRCVTDARPPASAITPAPSAAPPSAAPADAPSSSACSASTARGPHGSSAPVAALAVAILAIANKLRGRRDVRPPKERE